jgi:hypothetical protein
VLNRITIVGYTSVYRKGQWISMHGVATDIELVYN